MASPCRYLTLYVFELFKFSTNANERHIFALLTPAAGVFNPAVLLWFCTSVPLPSVIDTVQPVEALTVAPVEISTTMFALISQTPAPNVKVALVQSDGVAILAEDEAVAGAVAHVIFSPTNPAATGEPEVLPGAWPALYNPGVVAVAIPLVLPVIADDVMFYSLLIHCCI